MSRVCGVGRSSLGLAPPHASACFSMLRTAASTTSGRTGFPETCSVRSDGSWPPSMALVSARTPASSIWLLSTYSRSSGGGALEEASASSSATSPALPTLLLYKYLRRSAGHDG